MWVLLVLLSSSPSFASTGFKVDVFGVQDGLPQGSVISLIQTRDGYLWMGTLGGLVRFDGMRFKVFDISNTPGLNSSEIVYLFEDSRSNLWVGTQSTGVLLIKDGKVSSLNDFDKGQESRLVSVCEDDNGVVWLYTADGQLARYRDGRVIRVPGRLPPSLYRSVIMEEGRTLWVGMDHRQVGLNPGAVAHSDALPPLEYDVRLARLELLLASKGGGYWRVADGHVQKCQGNRVEKDLGGYPWKKLPTCACEDQQGNLIVGTLGDGLWWLEADGTFTQISEKQGLSHSYLLSLTMDREGNLWAGTDGGGLNRIRTKNFKAAEISSLPLTVQSICEDAAGGLWISTKGGARYLNGPELKEYGPIQGLASTNGQSIFVDRNQTVWAGTDGLGLFQLQDRLFQEAPGSADIGRKIQVIYQDAKGVLWVGTEKGLARWDEQAWKLFPIREGLGVRALANGTHGELLVGTDGGGLYLFAHDKFTHFGTEAGLAEEKVSSLLLDGEGVLWMGTRGKGLLRSKAGQWTRFSMDDGLASNSINYLLDDGLGFLWLGSYGGLLRVQKQQLAEFAKGKSSSITCRVYGEADGLPSGECTAGSQPAACRTRDGKLWFPTSLGLGWIDPSKIQRNTNPPPIVIESVLVDGRSQNTNGVRTKLPDTITLKPGQERIDIEFTSLNLAARDKARFQYRMERHEKEWTDAGNRRIASYPKLPPGNYRFQVKAWNEDGVGSTADSTLAFVVEPPFWRTWWFITATTLLLVGIIVGIVHYVSTQKLQHQLASLKQQQALEKERQRIARDIHDQVGASLTQVSMLGEMVESDKDVPEEVEAHGQQIAQTARETAKALDEIVWAVNPSNDTLDGLITYFCKYAQEYLSVANLRYRLDVPQNLPNTPIPPDLRHNIFLAAKEAVTNIVKHSKASAARIRLHLETDRFVLDIEDNGKGMADMDPARAKTRNGLSNMRKRLEEVGGSFSIGPGAEGGTLVRLSAPLGNHKFDANRKAV